MAEDLKLRQKTTQELFEQNASTIEALSTTDVDILNMVTKSLEAELDSQGVPLYAEEAFAILTFIEALDADNTTDIEDLQEAIEAMRLAMIHKISSAWAAKDKGFFVN